MSCEHVVDMILDMVRNMVPDNGVKISHYEHDILTAYRTATLNSTSGYVVDKFDNMVCDTRNIIGKWQLSLLIC